MRAGFQSMHYESRNPGRRILKRRRVLPAAALAIAALTAFTTAACLGSLEKEYPEKRFFALSAESSVQQRSTLEASMFADALKIGRFRVSPRFASRGLVYRRSDVSYETDFYNEFLTGAAVNITEETRRWLSKSGIFARVVDLSSQVDACYILEAQVNEIYADLRQDQPASVIDVQFILLRYGEAVMFERSYAANAGAASSDGAALVRAHNQNLVTILGKLENDLKQLQLPNCNADADDINEPAKDADEATGPDS
ncbi:MAG: ABC-type transport auxiliary lipoprotein family protein [bacterium]|nr:ABC-type transport auxiliary lipoprotein family protein [bacterium]